MKKILVAVNGIMPAVYVITFAIRVAKQLGCPLQGVFFKGSVEPADTQYPFPNDISLTDTAVTKESLEGENSKLLNDYVRLFKDVCLEAGIAYEISIVITLGELLNQSSSADLIIAGADARFPTFSIDKVLAEAYCPVYLVGTKAHAIDKIILAYDGSETSKYAIKKYGELFPHHHHLPTFLVSVNLSPMEILEDKHFLNKWLPKHFSNLTVKELEGNVNDALFTVLQQNPVNTLIVMGAFGRSSVSRFFHPSTANVVLKETGLSLFVAHE